MSERLGGLVLAVSLVVPLGCDDAPAKSTLLGWPPGEAVEVGTCRFLLKKAEIYHSSEWHLEAEVYAENTGTESLYCSYSARLMTASDTPLTDAAKAGTELGPDEDWAREAMSREANMTGMSSGAAEGAWVYVELGAGRWPMGDRTGVHVDPERIRPPG